MSEKELYCEKDAYIYEEVTFHHSSEILLGYLKKHIFKIPLHTLLKLQRYNTLYNSYTEKHKLITSLEKSYSNCKKALNPFKIMKKIKITEELLREYSNIYTIIIELMQIESSIEIKNILSQYDGHMLGIANEVLDRCHIDHSSYIRKENHYVNYI